MISDHSNNKAFAPPQRRHHFSAAGWSNYWRDYHRTVHSLYEIPQQLEAVAQRSWEIYPACTTVTRPAYYLPGRFGRITGMAYTNDPEREVAGGRECAQAATRGYLMRDVWLIDGSLYLRGKRFDLYSRNRLSRLRKYLPRSISQIEVPRAAIYSTYEANEYFGLWLTDDCATYPLAAAEGVPVTATFPNIMHIPQYERLLDMHPTRSDAAFLREAVMFDDSGRHAHKAARFAALRERILARLPGVKRHPGVFIFRRGSGNTRILVNEQEVAEHLRRTRGFRVADVTRDDLPTLMRACAGAEVIAGVEGSHLMHGLMTLQPGGSVLTLQPPHRFCAVIKRTTDLMDQHFGMVMGMPDPGGFRVDLDELDRTLDLLPRPQAARGAPPSGATAPD